MDFELDDAQRLLADSAQRWAAERCSFTQWQAARRAGGSLADARWAEMAGLGWATMALPPELNGLGFGPIECGVVAEALGDALVAEPFLQSGVIGAALIGALPSSPERQALAGALGNHGARIALAHHEASMADDEWPPTTRACQHGNTWRLSGTKSVVMGAAQAHTLIVSAQTDNGPALFAVAPDALGLAMQRYATVDAQLAADLGLDGVTASAWLGAAEQPLARARNAALAAIGAEAVGLMDRLLRETQDYTRTRRQFGQALASFQALRHRLVDMFMQIEAARSLVLLATIRLAEGDADAPRALAAMKVKVGQAGRFIGQQAVQLHGGMGMTDELAIGHAFKRLMALDMRLGNADCHLQRLAALDAAATA